MKIAIAGYGQMGEMIRKKALAAGHEVGLIIDPRSESDVVTARELPSTLPPLDVIIDFTVPGEVVANIERYAGQGLNAVIGTTGWYPQMEKVRAVVEESGIGLIWSANFSLGVNLFFRLLETAADLMNRFPRYDVMVHEYHHRLKADSPSGTSKMIGEILLARLESKTGTVTALPGRKIDRPELHLSSTRGGAIPGTHQVIFDSEEDTILIEHRARNREGFAEGALVAAQWVSGCRGFFGMEDMMQSLMGGD